MATYYKVERECVQCGNAFWGTARANFCGGACRLRHHRAVRVQDDSRALGRLCEEVARRIGAGRASHSKILIRLLRAVAYELRARDWNPRELLDGSPDDPVTGDETAPGGIEWQGPHRVKFLHPPEIELEMLESAIENRLSKGQRADWYEQRLEVVRKAIERDGTGSAGLGG